MDNIQPGDTVTTRSGDVYTVIHGVWYGYGYFATPRLTVCDDEVSSMPIDLKTVVSVTRGGVEIPQQLELWGAA